MLVGEEAIFKSHPRALKSGLCAKCKETIPKISVRTTSYCEPCFLAATTHRFRTNFLKLKLKDKPKVLLAISGGPASRCLLDLLASFSTTEADNPHRKLIFESVLVCHIDQSGIFGERKKLREQIAALASQYSFPFTSIALEDLFLSSDNVHVKNISNELILKPNDGLTSLDLLKKSFFGASLSASEDLLQIYIMRCLNKQALNHGCNTIMLGDSASLLAVRSISDTSKGRGFNLWQNTALSSDNHSGFQILRPLRDTLSEEVAIFNKLRYLESFDNSNITTGKDKTSIEKMSAEFIGELQLELPSTTNTITRTAFKIRESRSEDICSLCNGFIEHQTFFFKKTANNIKVFCGGCNKIDSNYFPADILGKPY